MQAVDSTAYDYLYGRVTILVIYYIGKKDLDFLFFKNGFSVKLLGISENKMFGISKKTQIFEKRNAWIVAKIGRAHVWTPVTL